jgi:hypothetical protein
MTSTRVRRRTWLGYTVVDVYSDVREAAGAGMGSNVTRAYSLRTKWTLMDEAVRMQDGGDTVTGKGTQ